MSDRRGKNEVKAKACTAGCGLMKSKALAVGRCWNRKKKGI